MAIWVALFFHSHHESANLPNFVDIWACVYNVQVLS